jgi:hydrogenase maturation protein HypF
LKNTVALSVGENIFVSQHIGDLETEQAYRAFKNSAADLPRLYDAKPDIIACDLHPEYLSTKFARENSRQREVVPVQHHWAHIAACMAENEIEPPALGVAWDGTGFGTDETIWGGEFLLAKGEGFERVAHLRQFRLPGGDAAIKNPRRTALGLLYEMFGDALWKEADLAAAFGKDEIPLLRQILEKKINAPLTSSAGRLFDAVAALLGLCSRTTYEGQAAMQLEFALRRDADAAYSFSIREGSPLVIDWQPGILELINDHQNNVAADLVAAKFHNMLVETIVAVARKIGEPKIALSGGCFQNRYLTERAINRLRAENFRPYWHQRIPPNDGGIALGQIVAANWAAERRS